MVVHGREKRARLNSAEVEREIPCRTFDLAPYARQPLWLHYCPFRRRTRSDLFSVLGYDETIISTAECVRLTKRLRNNDGSVNSDEPLIL